MRPLVMGILNVTPDSFSDGGRYTDVEAALAHAREMVAEGADVIDVGGESTRPGAPPVAAAEERRRVVPVIEALAAEVGEGVRISVDTSKPEVAEAALAAGARMLNDVSASLDLARLAAGAGVPWIAMHMRGTPETMRELAEYQDVVAEVAAFLTERAEAAAAIGTDVWVDPGIGFAKTAAHNWSILRRLGELTGIAPVVVGASRKSFLGGDGPDDRADASLAAATIALANGAAMVRVHDVRPAADAARLVAACTEGVAA